MIANTSLGEPVKYCPRCRSELEPGPFMESWIGQWFKCVDCHLAFSIFWAPRVIENI